MFTSRKRYAGIPHGGHCVMPTMPRTVTVTHAPWGVFPMLPRDSTQYVAHRDALAQLMMRAGINTPRLAELTGISTSHINYILSGQRVIITDAVRDALADALSVQPEDIGTDADAVGQMFSMLALRRNPLRDKQSRAS